MQEVARHLQIYAHRHSGDGKDAFARSAYNRYYYACYLLLRELVSEMDPRWKQTRHKSFPDLLGGQITKRLKQERNKARRAEDYVLYEMIQTSLRAVREMTRIIKDAYATRLVADYEPAVAVDFTGPERFSLNNVDITQAHEWQDKLSTLVSEIRSTWNQFDA